MKINYLTSNALKFKIAQKFFSTLEGYELTQRSLDIPEVQDVSCEVIAREAAIQAAKLLGEPCVAMDAGFFIDALGGFPGPYVKHVNEWLSEERLLRMLSNDDTRSAYFMDALAIGFPDGSAEVFAHKTVGRLANKGEYEPSKWPANSLFIPEGYGQPLGLMSDSEQVDFWNQENVNWAKLVAFLVAG